MPVAYAQSLNPRMKVVPCDSRAYRPRCDGTFLIGQGPQITWYFQQPVQYWKSVEGRGMVVGVSNECVQRGSATLDDQAQWLWWLLLVGGIVRDTSYVACALCVVCLLID